MAFGKNIEFNISSNNFGTPQPGLDYVSGALFTSTTLPTGFSYSQAKQIFSVTQAEGLGIVGDYSDEVLGTASITIGVTASAGTSLTFTVAEPNINSTTTVVTIGSYETSVEMTKEAYAAKVIDSINYTGSGYTAAVGGTSSVIIVTARAGVGALINTVAIGATGVASTNGAFTYGTFANGVSSKRKQEHYQISEFFRLNLNGALWVIYSDTTVDFNLLNTMQNQANNEIRQALVYKAASTTNGNITSDLDAIQAVCATMASNYAPMNVIYSPNLVQYTDLSLLPNIRTRSDNFVSCILGQDGGGLGAYLSIYNSESMPCLGAVLGLISKAPVSDNIGWVGKYSITTGLELSIPAFTNKQLYSTLYTNYYGSLNQLNESAYMFLMTRPNIGGTWVNDTHTAIAKSDDRWNIERNRTLYKVLREANAALTPLINSALVLKADGTLTNGTIETFTNALDPNLGEMVKNTEISAYSVLIDPTQNVQSTSSIALTIRIVGIGVARTIVVNLGFALSV